MFKHTYVEVDDTLFRKGSSTKPEGDTLQQQENSDHINSERMRGLLQPDIFCFYNLRVNLPKTFFERLGQADLVTPL